jgi:uncharacterized membrane protein
MLNKIKTRIQNPKVITAVVAGILLILVNTGVMGIDMSAKVTDTVNIILGIGVTLGIFGDPESHVQE